MRFAIWALLLCAAAASLAPAQPAALQGDERILHALSRLTYGPRPGQLEEVRQMGLDPWIELQLKPEGIADPVLAEVMKRYRTFGLSLVEQRTLYTTMAGESSNAMMGDVNTFRSRVARELRASTVHRALVARAQLTEVLADFWRNHLSVDLAKDSVRWTASHYEASVIRAHLWGRFVDMLDASARHPSMLVFLDNYLSRKPPSKARLREIERMYRRKGNTREEAREQAEIARQRGLNENYARELMELHTLGVDNGYDQRDVESVALAFTGWSVDLNAEDGVGFVFKEGLHDESMKTALRRPIPRARGASGITEGETILERLAAHENTARFIATKLVRYLVNDSPPEAIVDAAAKTFRQTKGDLREVVRTIVKHPGFFDPEHFKAKFKTPLEFVISALRATNATVDDANRVADIVADLGMPIYGCEDPTGWEDTAEAWRDPGVMALRWKFAVDLVRGRVKGVAIPESFYSGLPEDPLDLMDALVKRVLPQGLGTNTLSVLERVVFKQVQAGAPEEKSDRHSRLAESIVGILIGSPEFQQQ